MCLDRLFWNNSIAIDRMSDVLKAGQIVLGSSDTVIGLLSDVNDQGFERLNAIKERTGKPYIILLCDKEKIGLFSSLQAENNIGRLMDHCWPGPLTLIVRAKDSLPDFLKSSDATIALRVPAHTGLLTLLERFDGLFSTSANKAGQPVAHTLDDVNPDIVASVAQVILDKDKEPRLVPSTILDATGKRIKVIREGAYSIAELEKIYGASFEK